MENVKNKTVLIIPDIHGREFWKEGVEKRRAEETIIFLGDYTDPYPHEGISHEVVPGILEEIIELSNSVLLLGNHDLSYIYPNSPECRKDTNFERLKWLEEFFEKNHSKFSLTHTIHREDSNTDVIFSHAGLLEGLYHTMGNPAHVAEQFNIWWKDRDHVLESELFKVGWLRGGDSKFGSLVWADVREHVSKSNQVWDNYFQVFGHTMLKEGKIVNAPQFRCACVDCQRPVRMWWDLDVPEFEVL